MNRRICNSIALATYYGNGELLDFQNYDGTVTAAQNIADDIASFTSVWEDGESYKLFVNENEVDHITNE